MLFKGLGILEFLSLSLMGNKVTEAISRNSRFYLKFPTMSSPSLSGGQKDVKILRFENYCIFENKTAKCLITAKETKNHKMHKINIFA